MLGSKTVWLIGAIFLLVGAALLVAALVNPWYSYAESGRGLPGGGIQNESSTYYPGIPSTSGTIRYSCGGTGFEGSRPCPSQTSYSNAGLNNTGVVAATGFFLVVGSVALGTVAGVLGMASRVGSRTVRPAIALAVISLVLAIAAPGAFALALPRAIGKDSPGHPANGPWSTFFGSSSSVTPLAEFTTTWGPAIGWYLSIVAFVLLLIGVILLTLYRKEPPQPPAAPSSPAPVTSAVPPPSSPLGP